MSKPILIRTLLESLIAAKGWEGRVELYRVFELWDDLVGPDIARQAQPHVIHKSVLWIRVSDSVWMQQLHMLKAMLLDKLNSGLRQGKLGDLRFQLDSSLGCDAIENVEKAAEDRLHLPSEASKKVFESLLGSIKDEELRAAIRQCWLKTGHLHGGRESNDR